LIDLRLVQVSDRFDIGKPVAALHEEALVVLEPVRRSEDRIMEPVRMIVLRHLPDPLLEARRGHDRPIFVGRQTYRPPLAVRRFDDEAREVQSIPL
jgi:hypothetical protein